MDKMRSTSSFEVDDDIRDNLQNPELLELLARCDDKTGGGKVPMDILKTVISEMQADGKLTTLG